MLALHDRAGALLMRHRLKQREQQWIVGQSEHGGRAVLRRLETQLPARDVLPGERPRPLLLDPLADDVLLTQRALELSRHADCHVPTAPFRDDPATAKIERCANERGRLRISHLLLARAAFLEALCGQALVELAALIVAQREAEPQDHAQHRNGVVGASMRSGPSLNFGARHSRYQRRASTMVAFRTRRAATVYRMTFKLSV